DGDEAARRPFEQQQFYRQHDRGDGRAEHRGHAGGGAGHQQRLPLGIADRQHLRDQGADGAAGHDDRTFRAERPAAADGDRRGQRLEDGDLPVQPAAAEEDRLDRFGDAMAADLLAAIACHQADDQRAGHRHQGRRQAKRGLAEREVAQGEAAEIGDIGAEADQVEQDDAAEDTGGADDDGEPGDHQHARIGGEVAEVTDTIGQGMAGYDGWLYRRSCGLFHDSLDLSKWTRGDWRHISQYDLWLATRTSGR